MCDEKLGREAWALFVQCYSTSLFAECKGLERGRRVCSADTKIILRFLLVSEPAASDRKNEASAAAGAAAR